MSRELLIGVALSPTWLRGQSWRLADSRAEEMFSLPYYRDIALAAEAGGIDFLFLPDPPHLDRAELGRQPGFSTLDSMTLASALAGATDRIGIVPTIHTLFDSPYAAARRLQTLRHISRNRAGWNAVTALGGANNHGPKAAQSGRYERAAEFVTVVEALLSSYPAEALLFDRERGRFADAEKIQPISHAGDHFTVEGPLGTPAPPGQLPPVFQAGGSAEGQRFAARSAAAVFGAATTPEAAREQRTQICEAAVRYGRVPDAVAFLPGLSLTLADTQDEAATLHEKSAGANHWTVVGTAEDAIREIEAWNASGAIDGFIALPTGSLRSLDIFLEQVMPRLSTGQLLRTPMI